MAGWKTGKHTPAQQRLYRALVRELGLDDDTRRLITQSRCGRRSTQNLTKRQMKRLIDYLLEKGGKAQAARQRVRGGASVGQVKMIRALEAALGWTGNAARLAGFLRRMTLCKVYVVDGQRRRVAGSIGDAIDDPEDLNASQAMKVIEGLKQIQANRRGLSYAEREAMEERDESECTTWS